MTETELHHRTFGWKEVDRQTMRHRRVPVLHLEGAWLEKAGFTPGTQAILAVSDGKIVITKRE